MVTWLVGVDLIGDGIIRVEKETSASGADLASFQRLEDAAILPGPAPPPAPGPCHVCHERESRLRCHQCGQGTCHEDAWLMLGLCRVCVPEDEMRNAREGSNRPRPNLDIKWIQD